MNKQEELLKTALEKITPDIWDSIAEDINREETEIKAKPQMEVLQGGAEEKPAARRSGKAKRPAWFRQLTVAAACLIVVLGGVWGFSGYNAAHAVDSIISLDVNPSIEIIMNSKDRVLDVVAGNEDAEKVIGDMDFKGTDIDVAINAIIGSMMRNGYLSEMKNSILVSVDNKDKEKGEALRVKLMDEISDIMDQGHVEGAILGQVVEEDHDLEDLAEQYGISVGKARLIARIIESNPKYAFGDLAKLSINELNLLSENHKVVLSDIDSKGTASDRGYIGKDRAKAIALESAGLEEAQVSRLEVEIDYENGVMVYEVEFTAGGTEYEYEVNALTGDIVSGGSEGGSPASGTEGEDPDDDDDDDDAYEADDDADDQDDQELDDQDDQDDADDDTDEAADADDQEDTDDDADDVSEADDDTDDDIAGENDDDEDDDEDEDSNISVAPAPVNTPPQPAETSDDDADDEDDGDEDEDEDDD